MKIKQIISENLGANELKSAIFESAKDEFTGMSAEARLKKSKEIFSQICLSLNEFNALNKTNLAVSTEALNRAISYNEEQYLYKIMYEADKLFRQIDEQKSEIKELVAQNMRGFADFATQSNLENKNEIKEALDDRLLEDLELLGILKETSEFAFLNAIENAKDVENLSFEIAKNIVYNAIGEGEFKKERFLNISRVVVKAAIGVANESKIYATQTIRGAILGGNEAILKAISEFKDSIQFAPEELSKKLSQNAKELSSVANDFSAFLKDLGEQSGEPTKEIINEILDYEQGSYLVNLKRISEQTIAQISDKLAQIAKIKDENIENLKKEWDELEKVAISKLQSAKISEAKTKARELGKRVFDAAKSLIDKKD